MFSPDGSRIVSTGREDVLRMWDARNGEEVRRLDGHTGGIRTCACSPDGVHLVTGADDTTLRLWNAEKGTERAVFTGLVGNVTTCAFSPDGRRVVVGDGVGKVFLLSVENVERLPVVVTASGERRRGVLFKKGPGLSCRCPYCAEVVRIDAGTLGQESACAGCGERIRLNPFWTER